MSWRTLTCTLASLKSSRSASSSRVNTSGYCVFSKARSSWWSWYVVNVVRLRRIFLGLESLSRESSSSLLSPDLPSPTPFKSSVDSSEREKRDRAAWQTLMKESNHWDNWLLLGLQRQATRLLIRRWRISARILCWQILTKVSVKKITSEHLKWSTWGEHSLNSKLTPSLGPRCCLPTRATSESQKSKMLLWATSRV